MHSYAPNLRAHIDSNDYFSIFICFSLSFSRICLFSSALPFFFYLQIRFPFLCAFNWLNDFSAWNLISSIWIPLVIFFPSLWKARWSLVELKCSYTRSFIGFMCEWVSEWTRSYNFVLRKNFINSIIKRIALTGRQQIKFKLAIVYGIAGKWNWLGDSATMPKHHPGPAVEKRRKTRKKKQQIFVMRSIRISCTWNICEQCDRVVRCHFILRLPSIDTLVLSSMTHEFVFNWNT